MKRTHFKRAILALLFIGLLVTFFRSIRDVNWIYSIDSNTDTAHLKTINKNQVSWRIDDANICIRDKIEDSQLHQVSDRCKGRWNELLVDTNELTITFDTKVDIKIDSKDSLLRVYVESDSESVGTLNNATASSSITLPSRTILFLDTSENSYTLPFIGRIDLGSNVNHSETMFLRDGTISIYSADESVDKRTKIDELDLIFGDQVSLSVNGTKYKKNIPHGIVKAEDNKPLKVVAFGNAKSILIERYGENSIKFEPTYIGAMKSDHWYLTFINLLLLLVGMLGTLYGIFGKDDKK